VLLPTVPVVPFPPDGGDDVVEWSRHRLLIRGGGPSYDGGAGPQQIHYNVSITVNGNADDPEELVRVIAPRLRDELRRIDTRYSRAGNKAQV